MITKAKLDAHYGARTIDLLNRFFHSCRSASDATQAVSRFQALLEDGVSQRGSSLTIDTAQPSATLCMTVNGMPMVYTLEYLNESQQSLKLDQSCQAHSVRP